MEDLEKFEKLGHRGQRLTGSNKKSNFIQGTHSEGNLSPETPADSSSSEISHDISPSTGADLLTETTTPSQSSSSMESISKGSDIEVSQFKSIAFKQGLKTKGRPKRKSKQITFNKTSLDRERSTKKAKHSTTSFKSMVQSHENTQDNIIIETSSTNICDTPTNNSN